MSCGDHDAAPIEWAPPAWFELDEGAPSTSRRARCTSSEPSFSTLKATNGPRGVTTSPCSSVPPQCWSAMSAKGLNAGKRTLRTAKWVTSPASPSCPLLFPLSNPLPSWPCMQEQMKSNMSGANHPQSELVSDEKEPQPVGNTSEDLLARLQQAEQSLAEKDQRIEALEACTTQLAERLALAEGLRKTKDPFKDPSTPTSTRSTSDSTAWSRDLSALRRNCTQESLGSDGSSATYAPQTPPVTVAAAKSTRKSPKSSDRPGIRTGGMKVPAGEYATEADVDSVCRRCEQLLKSVTAAVEINERLAIRRKQQKCSQSMRFSKGSKQSTASV
ncbi:unnamed protein product [Symbiodinium natans]|uniref:Uncharacterized protein n=1 Tax=Symbiodinium natans TaxID=878477 RepID=A0A812NSP5_9DINO|nr:unnamed protein product [Symbiodinium natans]